VSLTQEQQDKTFAFTYLLTKQQPAAVNRKATE